MDQFHVNKIKKWEGFANFEENDVNFICEFEHLITNKKCTVSVLMEAVERGELEIVKSLLDNNCDVNYISKTTHETALLSIREETQNKIEIAKLLIDSGADINFVSICDKDLIEVFDGLLGNDHYTSALSNAFSFGDLDFIKLLINSGAKINNLSRPINNLDFNSENIIDIVDFLIVSGSDINSNYGQLLKCAIRESNFIIIDKLTSVGSKVDIRNETDLNDSKTALMLFLDNESSQLNIEEEEIIFYKLWRNLEKINVKDNYGKSLLFYAINNNIGHKKFNLKIFDFVLTHQELDINLKDNNGNTALNYLLEFIEYELEDEFFEIDDDDLYKIKMLIIGKTDVLSINKNGNSPKNIFTKTKNKKLSDFLIEPFLIVNQEDVDGHTQLINSVLDNNFLTTKWLLENGALINLSCNRYYREKGITPLMMAQSIEMIYLLVHNGADINSQDFRGNTVLMHYAKRSWFEGVKLILDLGANPNYLNKDYDTALSIAKKTSKYVISVRKFDIIDLIKSKTDLTFKNYFLHQFFRIIN